MNNSVKDHFQLLIIYITNLCVRFILANNSCNLEERFIIYTFFLHIHENTTFENYSLTLKFYT